MSESHEIKIHTMPSSFDLMGGPWAAAALADVTVAGKVVICLDCGSVVVPDLMGVHERRHGRERLAG